MDILGRFAKRKLFQIPRRSLCMRLKCACHWHWLPARATDCTYLRCHSVPKIPGRCLVAYASAGTLARSEACGLLLACSLGSARVGRRRTGSWRGGDDPWQPPAAPRLGLEVALRVMVRPFPGPVWRLRPALRRGSCSAVRRPARAAPAQAQAGSPASRRVLRGSGAASRGGRGQRAPRMSGLGPSGASGFKIVFDPHIGCLVPLNPGPKVQPASGCKKW